MVQRSCEFIKAPVVHPGALRDDAVHLFVFMSVRLSVCMSVCQSPGPRTRNAVCSQTKQFRAMVFIDDCHVVATSVLSRKLIEIILE